MLYKDNICNPYSQEGELHFMDARPGRPTSRVDKGIH